MLSIVLAALGVVLLAAVASYYLAPGAWLRFLTWLGRRGAGLRSASVMVDGHRVPYLHGGRGEPLLLLHGFAANKDNWTMIARLLTPHFRVIVPDLPGFGDASRLPAASYGIAAQLARLHAFLDTLGLDKVHLGGNSMGGYLATLFAARHPERVMSLWLLAPAGAFEGEASETFELVQGGVNPLIVEDAAGLARLTALCFCKPPWFPAQLQRAFLDRARAEAPFNRKIFDELFAEPVPLSAQVERVPVRTLLVWGDSDRILHPGGQAELRPLFADVECILMRAMGHAPMLERPAETALDYLRFHHRLPAG